MRGRGGRKGCFALELYVLSGPAATTTKAAGRASSSRRDTETTLRSHGDSSMSLHPEVWETEQLQRAGFPLREQVVHFSLAVVVIGPTGVVHDAVCHWLRQC